MQSASVLLGDFFPQESARVDVCNLRVILEQIDLGLEHLGHVLMLSDHGLVLEYVEWHDGIE
jgi:hypothetical protein